MQKVKMALAVAAVFCVLTGCGQNSEPDISSVSINKDGTVTHRIVGGFEQNYYDLEELRSLAEERVSEYRADRGEDSVTLSSIEEKDGTIYIQLDYATQQDYSSFNHREMFVGTLEDAVDAGYPLETVPFVSADGEPLEIGYMDDWEQKQIAVIATKPSEELLVKTYGKVLYINQCETTGLNVAFSGKAGVRISYPAQDTDGESVFSYIVFE